MFRINRRGFLALALAAALVPADASARPRVSRPGPKVIPRVSPAARSAVARASRAHGGHVHKHIGQSNAAMKARSDVGNIRGAFKAAATNKPLSRVAKANARPRMVGTFHSDRKADAMYQQALRANRKEIQAWMAKPTKEQYRAKFVANQAIGTTYVRPRTGGAGRFTPASEGQFLLRQTPGNKGFYPHTVLLSQKGAKK